MFCIRRNQQAARAVALILFSTFATYSFLKLLRGDLSCGCFGNARVTPAVSLAIDVAALGLLLASSCPSSSVVAASALTRQSLHRSFSLFCRLPAFCIVFGIAFGIIAAFGLTESGFSPQPLDPFKFIGKNLPFDNIDVGNQLSKGKWIVLFFHHDCSKCSETMARLQRQLSNYQQMPGVSNESVAFIEMPPYGQLQEEIYIPALIGYVQTTSNWNLSTPSIFHIANGIVQSVE